MSGHDADRFSLAGRVVAVTGASGMLGASFARAVVDAGASVVLLDVAPPRDGQVEELTQRAAGADRVGSAVGRVLHVTCDVSDDASVAAAHAAAASQLGAVDGLINCAAIDAPPRADDQVNGPFETTSVDTFNATLDVNLAGVVRCCQVFGGAMAERGHGAIVNIASHYGVVAPDQRLYESLRAEGTPFFKPAAYTASKAGVIGLTKYLAAYWGAQGVRVNTLSPGGVLAGQDPRFVAAYTSRVPMGRMARADEYDGAVVFLLSDAASYMTGANLIMDGGFTAW